MRERTIGLISACAAFAFAGLCVVSCAERPLPAQHNPAFDGAHAYEYLVKQCDLAPRTPGSDAHAKCPQFLKDELGKYCDAVSLQKFTYADKRQVGRLIDGTNIIASINGRDPNAKRILLCAHWDSRSVADHDPNPANRSHPVPGANDGASGVAVLLEMARTLKAAPPPVGVDLVLFDLEDMGDESAVSGDKTANLWCIGSQQFVEKYYDAPISPTHGSLKDTIQFGILLDMIGDKNLQIKLEANSWDKAGDVVRRVWASADRVGAKGFLRTRGRAIIDDHIAFLERGIKVIDLIDFDYPYWHTTQDTPDKCTAASLQQVGDVLVDVIYVSQEERPTTDH